jgi:Insertion element 4 transposase N-terminal/Transposase DDE domain
MSLAEEAAMARHPARLPNGTRISDHVTLGVLTATVPAELVDAVLTDTGRQSQRQRQLPARLVVYYVIALALYAQVSYGEVLRCLLEGLRWLHLKGLEIGLTGKSAITQARVRLGVAPLKKLFERVAHPIAEPGAPGAWYRGRRLVSLDGTTIALPDTPELEARYGRPKAARGASGFPQMRLLTIVETGTHALFAVAADRYTASELRLAPQLFPRLKSGMLCLADRAFVGLTLWRLAAASGADLLWRVRANQQLPWLQSLPDGSYLSRLYSSPWHRRLDKEGITVRVMEYRLEGIPDAEPLYRLITTLLDPAQAPAAELAALYHERWEAESTLAELKVKLPGRRLMLRSRRVDLAEQELYGLLLAHLALRRLMYDASRKAGCDPDTLSFIHTVRIVRRQLPFYAAAFSPAPASSHARHRPDRDPGGARRTQPRPPQPARRQTQDEQFPDQGARRFQIGPSLSLRRSHSDCAATPPGQHNNGPAKHHWQTSLQSQVAGPITD